MVCYHVLDTKMCAMIKWEVTHIVNLNTQNIGCQATITYFMWMAGFKLLYTLLSSGTLNIFKIKYTILLRFKYINVSF